jgi:hypothetical protein
MLRTLNYPRGITIRHQKSVNQEHHLPPGVEHIQLQDFLQTSYIQQCKAENHGALNRSMAKNTLKLISRENGELSYPGFKMYTDHTLQL